MCMHVQWLSCVPFAAPWTVANQAPLSMGSSLPSNHPCLLCLLLWQVDSLPLNTWEAWDKFQFSSVQSLSCVRLFVTPWITARQASLSITISRVHSNSCPSSWWCPSNHLILCCPLFLLPPISPSIRVFSNESTLCMRWPKYWSFSFSIVPSKEHPRPISFRMDWLDLLAVQGTQESSRTPQFKSINSSVLSFLHSPTLASIHDHRKNHSLTRRTFVGKVTSLLLNMLSRLVITFLPRSKRLLISYHIRN